MGSGTREAPARAYLPLRRPEPRVHRARVGIHDLVIADKTIVIDGVEVLSSRARMQVAVVKELANQRVDDLTHGRVADECGRVKAKKILKALGSTTKTDEEGTVSKYINRARADMAAKYEEDTGIPLDTDEIIESSPVGYRLNPTRVAVRFA